MDLSCNGRGFTLLEVLIAMVVLSIGLLATAGLTAGIMRGNLFSNRMTTATTLAQEKMETLGRLGYGGTPTADTTITEDYGSMAQHRNYKRVTASDVADPAPGMKTVTVTVYWDSDAHSTSLTTIVAQ